MVGHLIGQFERPIVAEIVRRIQRPTRLMHVLNGPRQVGKSTAAYQIARHLGWPSHVATADSPVPLQPEWIEIQWETARRLAEGGKSVLLILDEIQKILGWSEVVKKLWDEDQRQQRTVQPIILGSASLLLQRGLQESAAGRYFLHHVGHWSLEECRTVFGWSFDMWLYFGGYPGGAPLVEDPQGWKQYINLSLIESVIARDVLQLQPIRKPALLRNLFGFATAHPAEILSYTKMMGQLQDAGNTTTLADYLNLLRSAFLVSGLERFHRGEERKRGSSPKLILWNNALVTAPSLLSPDQVRVDTDWRGRLLENAVGAHLLNELQPPFGGWDVTYWRSGDLEVDFVVTHQDRIWAIEVKSGHRKRLQGLAAFLKRYPDASPIVIAEDAVQPATFLSAPIRDLLEGLYKNGNATKARRR